MPDDPASPTPSPDPNPSPRPKSLLPTTVEGWFMLIVSLICIGYGTYTVIAAFAGGYALSLLGTFMLVLGGMITPIRLLGLAVGFVIVGLAIYMFIANYVTVQALVFLVLGLIGIAEHWRRLRTS